MRAAEDGDRLSFEENVFGNVTHTTGQFAVEEGNLYFRVDGGSQYHVRWEGFQKSENAASQFIPHGWQLETAKGANFTTEEQLRLYVNGMNSYSDPDYWEFDAGGYFGIGGNVLILHHSLTLTSIYFVDIKFPIVPTFFFLSNPGGIRY